MELYYKNETLFVDVDTALDDENFRHLKRRVFHIIDDYDIDHIVFKVSGNGRENRKKLQEMEVEYHQKYHGRMMIK